MEARRGRTPSASRRSTWREALGRQKQLAAEIAKLEADAGDKANLFGLVAPERRIDSSQPVCFVGNLPYECEVDDLIEYLTAKGFGITPNDVRMPADPDGRPRASHSRLYRRGPEGRSR